MLSIFNFVQGQSILEEDSGQEIAYDPVSKLTLFVSPAPNNFQNMARPETANQYFKVFNGRNSKNYKFISRIGFRNPSYEMHEIDNGKSVYLKPKTIQRIIHLLNQPYIVPNKPHIQREWDEYLTRKNSQIREFNLQNRRQIPLLQYFNNWQAAIIYTNQINGFNPDQTIMNDSRILGTQGVNQNYLPFDLEIPDYENGLLASEDQRRAEKSEYRNKVGRY